MPTIIFLNSHKTFHNYYHILSIGVQINRRIILFAYISMLFIFHTHFVCLLFSLYMPNKVTYTHILLK